jgi:hypothetical protein
MMSKRDGRNVFTQLRYVLVFTSECRAVQLTNESVEIRRCG